MDPFPKLVCIANGLDTWWIPFVLISKLNTNSMVRHFTVNKLVRDFNEVLRRRMGRTFFVCIAFKPKKSSEEMNDEYCSRQLWHAVEWVIHSQLVSGFIDWGAHESRSEKVLRFSHTCILLSISPLCLFLLFLFVSGRVFLSSFIMFGDTKGDQVRETENMTKCVFSMTTISFPRQQTLEHRQRCMHSLYRCVA